jgi:hypothetical protein
MKKTLYILLVAISALATVACSKEELFDSNAKQPQMRTFTCSFDEGDATKTDITQKGKTVWAEGDKLWVSNGTAFDTLTVDKAYAGQKYCEFKTALEGTIYVVYPFSAAKGITDGKFQIDVPSIQDGAFGSANICVAVATDRYVKMKNVTSVLQFRIPGDAKPIKAVSVNASDNAVAGTCTVDMSSGSPTVTASETTSDVIVKTDGLSGKFYMSVIPGTYNAGFSLTAVSTDLKNASQTKTTVAAKTLNVNELFDLGTIGDDLQPLQGDGSSASPWLISSLPEMLAFTYYVNDGNSMRGQYIKVVKDIKGISVPVGTYDEGNEIYHAFKGNFDGGDKTLTLNMRQTAKCSVGLFGNVADSAKIYNVKVAGYVSSSYPYAGALAGVVDAEKTTLTIDNCSSSATVTGTSIAGGLIGIAVGIIDKTISNSSNSGAVTSASCTAGICANAYHVIFLNDTNSGAITTTDNNGGTYNVSRFNSATWGTNSHNGTGGISGWAQNVTMKSCSNTADVSAVNKAGGISGTAYFGTVQNCTNSGKISTTEGVLGGIVAWAQTYANLINCTNTGVVDGAEKSGWVGGVLGYASPQVGNKYTITIVRCTNKGTVNANGTRVGGIVGNAHSLSNAGNRTMIDRCVNEGDVKSADQAVGGIVGVSIDFYSYTVPYLSNCSNKGNVTGLNYVGGVLGQFQRSIYTGAYMLIDNCENHGNILSTNVTDNGDYIGGILGGFTQSVQNARGIRFRNCLNDGKIQYATASHTKVYGGGIVGGLTDGAILNCFNGGVISPLEGTIATAALANIGGIAGATKATIVKTSYFLSTTAATALGTASGTADVSVIASDDKGNLASNASINSVNYAYVIDALNAQAIAWGLYRWTWSNCPALVYPTYSDPINGGDFDLGNGGQL